MRSLIITILITTLAWASSTTIHTGEGVKITLLKDSENQITIKVPSGSLDDYMTQQSISSVIMDCDVDVQENGDVIFNFSPSGAYFTTPLELTIKGSYAHSEMWLFDEDGEALESTKSKSGDKVTFEITHFSNYYYDMYDYY